MVLRGKTCCLLSGTVCSVCEWVSVAVC